MRIRWTEPAFRDFTDVCDYTAIHFSDLRAAKTAAVILDTVDILEQSPLAGRAGRKPGTRELVVPGVPFLVIYRVKADEVQIVRVLHGAQRWP